MFVSSHNKGGGNITGKNGYLKTPSVLKHPIRKDETPTALISTTTVLYMYSRVSSDYIGQLWTGTGGWGWTPYICTGSA